MERHGASHRITASHKQDQSQHHQITRAPGGLGAPMAPPRVIPWQWTGEQWRDDAGNAPSFDEVEAAGIDATGRMM
jgi:hypothetical protein